MTGCSYWFMSMAACLLLGIADEVLQPGSKPDSDGGCDDGSVEVHKHIHRKVKLYQLPQELHLLGFLKEGADV